MHLNFNSNSNWQNDKVYKYWKKNYLNKKKKRIINKNIKIKGKNYKGLYLIDETNINKKGIY